MSQHDFDIANQGMAAGRGDLNGALQALASTSIGATAPTTPYTGQQWIDNSGTPWLHKFYDGADWIVAAQIDPTANAFRPTFVRDHIAGLITATNGTDPAHDVDIGPGECRDVANSFDIVNGGTITVAIDASGANGLDTGTVAADEDYATWLIADSTGTNVPAGLFSLSFTSPVMPAGYDKRRLIGFRLTDASANIIDTVQVGDYFRLLVPVLSVDDANVASGSFETGTLRCPPNCEARCYGFINIPTATDPEGRIIVRRFGSGETNISDNSVFGTHHLAANFRSGSFEFSELVDEQSRIEYRASSSGGTASLRLNVIACRMLTRSAPV